MGCEYCGKGLGHPLEEAFNLSFIAHLRENARCMELFSYGVANLRNEIAVRHGRRPEVEGL